MTGATFKALFNLATCSNYVKISVFYFFEKVSKGHLKRVNVDIKNGHISQYCHFNKTSKGTGTSFYSPPLSQRYVKNIYLTKFYFDSTYYSKEISIS